MKDRLCTCVSDPEITCQIHPTLRSLKGYIRELEHYIEHNCIELTDEQAAALQPSEEASDG